MALNYLILHRKGWNRRALPGWLWGHLVTFEDPIEEWKFQARIDRGSQVTTDFVLVPGSHAIRAGIYFTPRARHHDAADIGEIYLNALRQTPRCIVIGEIRHEEEWTHALELASSGHFVITTTHAGSLTETFTRMFKALRVTNEAGRAMVANSLLGVIHLKGTTEISGYEQQEQAFPSCWRHTTQSLASLVSDGISSIIPDGVDVLGRRSMAKCIFERMISYYPHDLPPPSPDTQQHALKWASREDVLEA